MYDTNLKKKKKGKVTSETKTGEYEWNCFHVYFDGWNHGLSSLTGINLFLQIQKQ